MLDALMVHQAAKTGYTAISEDAIERQRATRKFEATLRRGWARAVRGRLFGRNRRLLELARFGGHEGRSLGILTVPLSQIIGSENRSRDFDIEFLPIREHVEGRWVGIATAMLRGLRIPPVELLHKRIDGRDVYFVRDGHHRISVARALGQVEIEAVVSEWE